MTTCVSSPKENIWLNFALNTTVWAECRHLKPRCMAPQRLLDNFATLPLRFIHAVVYIKKAATLTNRDAVAQEETSYSREELQQLLNLEKLTHGEL